MPNSTTPTTAWRRPAAQDRHPWKGAVHKALSPFSGHRPASTGRHHAAARAMESVIYTLPRVHRVLAATGLFVALLASSAHAAVPVRFERLDGFRAPGTPARLNKVGVLQIGPRSARNVLVLNPGTSASAAYFA